MKNKILEAIFIISAIIISIYFLLEIRQILVYIIISAILTIIGQPIINLLSKLRLGRIKIPHTASVIITILIFLGTVFLLGLSLIPLISEQAHSLSLLNISEIEHSFYQGISALNNWFSSHGIKNINLIDNENIKTLVDFSFIPDFLNSLVGTMGGLSIGLMIISFITFFFLKDKELIKKNIISIIPSSKIENYSRLANSIKISLSRYLFGLMIQVSILFTLYTFMLYVANIKSFVIIAMLGALLNLIPYVGPVIGFILMISLSITGNISENFSIVILPMITKILIGYTTIQLIDNFVNQPIIFSKTANAHPLEIFLVILIAGNLGGIIGMIIAVPTYTIFRIILKEFFSEFKLVKYITKSI